MKQNSGALFDHLADEAPNAMQLVNQKGVITAVNAVTAMLFGFTHVRDHQTGKL